jgi:hypothetical protein
MDVGVLGQQLQKHSQVGAGHRTPGSPLMACRRPTEQLRNESLPTGAQILPSARTNTSGEKFEKCPVLRGRLFLNPWPRRLITIASSDIPMLANQIGPNPISSIAHVEGSGGGDRRFMCSSGEHQGRRSKRPPQMPGPKWPLLWWTGGNTAACAL